MDLLIKNYEQVKQCVDNKNKKANQIKINPMIHKNCLDDANLFYSCLFEQDDDGDLTDELMNDLTTDSSIYFTDSNDATDESECSDFDYPSDVYDLSYDSG